jgi:hypothetical protein
LVGVAGLGIVIGSIGYAFAVGCRKTAYPRWAAAGNPLTFAILLALSRGSFRP